MRHLGSIALSIVLGAIAFVLAGVGLVKLATAGALINDGQATNWSDVGLGAGGLLIAGVLIAVLILTPISPLGPLVIGLVYIGAQAWALEDLSGITKLLGNSVLGIQGAAEEPLGGLVLLASVPLIATIVIPHRWRGKAVAEPAAATYPESTVPSTYHPGSPDQSYPQQSYPETSYPEPTSAAPDYPTDGAHDHGETPEQTTPGTAADADRTVVEESVAAERSASDPDA